LRRNQKKMEENREIQEILARFGATKDESRLIDEQIQQGDKVFAENDLPQVSPQTLARIEQTLRARLAATTTQDVSGDKKRSYATTTPARPRPLTLTTTSLARRLLPLAASIIIVFAILWANFSRPYPLPSTSNTIFDDDLSILELALSRKSTAEIDEFALTEVLMLWEDTNKEDPEQMIKKERSFENFSQRYYRLHSITYAMGFGYA